MPSITFRLLKHFLSQRLRYHSLDEAAYVDSVRSAILKFGFAVLVVGMWGLNPPLRISWDCLGLDQTVPSGCNHAIRAVNHERAISSCRNAIHE